MEQVPASLQNRDTIPKHKARGDCAKYPILQKSLPPHIILSEMRMKVFCFESLSESDKMKKTKGYTRDGSQKDEGSKLW